MELLAGVFSRLKHAFRLVYIIQKHTHIGKNMHVAFAPRKQVHAVIQPRIKSFEI
jgi:hypothetical protein